MSDPERPAMRFAKSTAQRPSDAVAEIEQQLGAAGDGLILCFAARRYPPDELAAALARLPAPAVGCTTAGELTPDGFERGSLVAAWFPAPPLRFGIALVEGLSAAEFSAGQRALARAAADLGVSLGALDPKRHFILLLADGIVAREEILAASIASAAPEITFAGGSAADDLVFESCYVFARGRAYRDAALVLVARTDLPFALIKSEHMLPTEVRAVVTSADPERRMVHELNGKSARVEYARLIGVPAEELNNQVAAGAPFACYVAGVPYVRSVAAIEGDSLRFACAVAEGAVLRLMRPGDLIDVTRTALSSAARAVGAPRVMIGFNCVGRYLEAEGRGIIPELASAMRGFPIIGFNTYGEQCNGLHINHTLTGIAIGG